tara:strand:- start:9595 stop:9903 length:309 start_codon:yes stop_codon:yes gene_type:complete
MPRKRNNPKKKFDPKKDYIGMGLKQIGSDLGKLHGKIQSGFYKDGKSRIGTSLRKFKEGLQRLDSRLQKKFTKKKKAAGGMKYKYNHGGKIHSTGKFRRQHD